MSESQDLASEERFPRFVETIERCVHRNAEAPVVEVVEAVGCVSHLALFVSVPRAVDALGIHDVSESEGRRDVDVFEQLERSIDGNAVLHAVAPVFDEVRFEELVFLRGDGVGELTGVGERNLLIPSFFSNLFFASEGIEA